MDVWTLLTVLLVVGSSPGRGEVADNTLEEVQACPYSAQPERRLTVLEQILKVQHRCFQLPSDFLAKLSITRATEEHGRLFRERCSNAAAEASECVATVARDADACLTDRERALFAMELTFLEAGVAASCADAGERASRAYGDEFRGLDFFAQVGVYSCVSSAEVTGRYRKGDEDDLPGFALRRFRAVEQARVCVGRVLKSRQRSADHIDSTVERLMAGMMCVAPGSGEVVSCRSIEVTTTPASAVTD